MSTAWLGLSNGKRGGVPRGFRWLRAWAVALVLPSAALAADPQITSFIDAPDPVAAGGLYTYTLRVDNNSAEAAANTRLTLDFGSGAVFVSAQPAVAGCTQASATRVVCALGTVGASGLDVREVVLTLRALGPGPTTINATATVSADNDNNPANNTQGAITTVISGANLRMAKTGTPNPAVGGGNITYTLTASNAGPNASGAVVLTDNLPPSLSFVSAAGNGWSCSNAGSVVTCTRSGPQAADTAMPPVTVVARVNASGGTVTNSASIAPAESGGVADPDSSDNTATADTNIVAGADLRIAQKTVTSALPAIAGSNVSFLIQPRNGGPAAAVSVQVIDPLPAGWTYVSASGPNWNCINSDNTVQCTRASLPVGATDDISVVARAPSNELVSPAGAGYTNTASTSSATADPDTSNNSGSVSVTVLRDGADLRLAKVKTPQPVALGFNMTSTITVTNNGPRVATGPLRVVESLSGEAYVAPPAGAGWTCDGSAPPLVVCTHPNAGGLAVGASLPALQITTQATAAGNASNTACTGASVPPGASAALASPPVESDPNNTNDCASASSTATTAQPDLAITKQTSTPTGGDNRVTVTENSVTYTLLVSNVSGTPQAATGIVITDDVPAYVDGATTFAAITATPSGGSNALFTCGNAAGRVTCTQIGGQLLQGASVTVSITVNRPLQEGTYTNTASVTNTNEGDPNPGNNQAAALVIIDPIADVEMTGKSVTPASVRAGEIATYVLSFRNNGPSVAQGVTVSDTFTFAPGDNGLTLLQIDSSAPGSTCSVAAGAQINAAQPALTCTIGTLARGETQTITLRVRPNFLAPNAARTFTNLARVSTTTAESPGGGDNGNNEQSATLAVAPAAIDLLVNKTDRVGVLNLDPVGFNGSAFLGYQVSVTNNGPSLATAVRVAENMTPPAGRRIRFVCDVTAFGGSTCNAPALCTVSNVTSAAGQALPTFNCSVPAGSAATGAAVGELAVGATKNIWLRFEALDTPTPSGDVYNNVATASANEADTQAANDSEGEQTTTRLRVSFNVTKTASNANPTLMQPFNWIINVSNAGPGNSLQTDVTDVLPVGTEATGTPTWTRTLQAGNGICTVSERTVRCPLGQLDATGSATITVPVRITSYPAGGTVTNTASVDTDPDKTGGIDTPGGTSTGSSTVPVQRSSLAGIVFDDTDRAGSNGGTPQAVNVESRIAGVVLTLSGTDLYGNPVSRSATTDASGAYLFNDLPPSNGAGYAIVQTQPYSYSNGPVAPPGTGPGAPTIAGSSYTRGGVDGDSSYSGIVLPASTNGLQFNFPELRSASLAGFVYVDVNSSGTREPATDTPIAGATVRLLNAATGALVASTTTDANGAYRFANLDARTLYTLEEPLPGAPAALVNGVATAGQVGGAPCAAGCAVQANNPVANTDRIASIDLSTGFDGTDFNFGEVQGSFISGLVWLDINRNATLDAAESTRLAAVTLRLVQGADCSSGATLQTTATAADGSYRFDGLRAQQNYLVCQTQPAGYGTGSANGTAGSNVISVTALPLGGSVNNNFGETAGSLSGAVYLDTGSGAGQTNNGLRDAGEAGLAGVPVTLIGRDITGAAVSLGTTTDANGNYRFDGLLQSDAAGYTVSEGAIPPATGSYADGRETAGSAGGNAAVNDSIGAVVLGADVDATGYLFGELVATSISGSVYADYSAGAATATNNGLREASEVGIAGVTVTLTGRDASGNAVVRSTVTDANGNYRFDDLLPSDGAGYTVSEGAIPAAAGRYNDGRDTAGSVGGSAAVNDVLSAIVLAAGVQASGYNFGELPVAPITGTIYLDGDRDGTLGAGDGRIPGVVIRLVLGTACSGTVVATTSSDANGNYLFSGASAGLTYTVCETQPAGHGDGSTNPGGNGSSSAPNAITISNLPATGSAGNHFGEVLGALSGAVYVDQSAAAPANTNNGVRDSGEPGIAGVVVTLSGRDITGAAVTRTTTTDAGGNYSFANLLQSDAAGYTLSEGAIPAAAGTYADGRDTAGSAGGSNAVNDRLSAIVLGGGVRASGYNFGELALAPISGTVYIDRDTNGQLGGSDGRLAGVRIRLVPGTSCSGVEIASTTTDASGNYLFSGATAGLDYVVCQTQPAGYGNGSENPGTAASTPGANIIRITSLPATGSPGNHFGERLYALSGQVWLDGNNDGTRQPDESGIPGVTLTLSGVDAAGSPVNRSAVTDSNGNYSFDELLAAGPAGYTVTEPAQPAGTTNGQTLAGSTGGTATPVTTLPSAISGIVLTLQGYVSVNNNFAEIPGSSAIEGRVWIDGNDNGLIDGSESGISGVTLELSGLDSTGRSVTRSLLTDASGNYRFDGLAPGSYTVREPNQPAGTQNGTTVPGSTSGTATAVATVPSTISGITLGLGVTSSANNFGERLLSPDLRVSKSLVETAITVGLPGHYRISVRNAGLAATQGSYTVSDRLPAGLTLAGVPSGSGWACSGAAGASSFTCSSSEVLAAGAANANVISATVNAAASAAAASPVSNAVIVEGGGELEGAAPTGPERDSFNGNPDALPLCRAAVDQNACRTPTPVQSPASLSGTVWLDGGGNPRLLDSGDTRLPGWAVEVVNPATGQVVGTATTGSDGRYQVTGLQPGIALVVRFRDPASGVVFGYPVNGETAPGSSGASCDAAATGRASSCVGTGASPWLTVVLAAGQNLPQQSLPVDPGGVVYDSGTRAPLPGSVVTLAPVGNCAGWNPASGLVGAALGGYSINGSAISMTVGSNGYYQFLFGPNAPATCSFGLTVTPPAGYTFTSGVIPPAAGPLVPGGSTGSSYAVQPQAGPPTAAVGTGTVYFLTLNTGSGGASIVHNHIPLDPALPGTLALSKTADRAVAEVGDTLRYTVTVSVPTGALPRQTTVLDRLPAGFTYIRGTAMLGSTVIADPQGGVGATLAFNLGAMPASRQLLLHYRVRVGVGAAQGDGTNRARGVSCGLPSSCVDASFNPVPGSVASNEGAFKVRVSGGVFTTDACVAGKVFVDCNGNHVQDREELGIPGVRLVMQDGTTLISDSEGKYSVCGLPAKSAVLKADALTLPQGSRLTTSSNRNLGDAGSLWLDLKNGELHRADFIEGSCSNTVLEQVKARRAQGEVRAPETEKKGGPALRFDSKAHGRSTLNSPQQGTDGANQQVPRTRSSTNAATAGGSDEKR